MACIHQHSKIEYIMTEIVSKFIETCSAHKIIIQLFETDSESKEALITF